MAAEATQIAPYSMELPETQVTDIASVHDQIAALAYRLWQERGCPEGSPEIDWLDAEQRLLGADTGR